MWLLDDVYRNKMNRSQFTLLCHPQYWDCIISAKSHFLDVTLGGPERDGRTAKRKTEGVYQKHIM